MEVADQVREGALNVDFFDIPCVGALDRAQCVRQAAWRELPLPPELLRPLTVVDDARHAPAPAAAHPPP